jgi:hypothetical protein
MSSKRAARVITWDGQLVPPELRELPPGQYALEPVDDEALTEEQDAGLEQGLASLNRGEGRPADEVAERLRGLIAKRRTG